MTSEHEQQQEGQEGQERARTPYRVRTFVARPPISFSREIEEWLNKQVDEGFRLHSMEASSASVARHNDRWEVHTTCVVVEEIAPRA